MRRVYWQEWRDSNPRPAVLETAALPTELHSSARRDSITRAPTRASRRRIPPPQRPLPGCHPSAHLAREGHARGRPHHHRLQRRRRALRRGGRAAPDPPYGPDPGAVAAGARPGRRRSRLRDGRHRAGRRPAGGRERLGDGHRPVRAPARDRPARRAPRSHGALPARRRLRARPGRSIGRRRRLRAGPALLPRAPARPARGRAHRQARRARGLERLAHAVPGPARRATAVGAHPQRHPPTAARVDAHARVAGAARLPRRPGRRRHRGARDRLRVAHVRRLVGDAARLRAARQRRRRRGPAAARAAAARRDAARAPPADP